MRDMNLMGLLGELYQHRQGLDTVIRGLEAAQRTPSARLIQKATADLGNRHSGNGASRSERQTQVALVRLAREVLQTQQRRKKPNASAGQSPRRAQTQERGSPAMRRAG